MEDGCLKHLVKVRLKPTNSKCLKAIVFKYAFLLH